ncbi:MAG: tetratricopeptide repeat-containing protein kinase family protein [Myxococcota bacterium]
MVRRLGGERSTDAIVDVFAQAAAGLGAAHAAGLVHRDFKPANVLVGDDGRVRVSDFGIAWHLDREAAVTTGETNLATDPSGVDVVATQGHAGTPAYMAPEQFLGDPVDGRTDQFGFCVALHEAVYGRRPFAGTSRASLAANVIAGRRLTKTTREPPPAWLERIIARGLSIDPAARYPSMEALRLDLSRPKTAGRVPWVIGSAVAAAVTAGVVVAAASGGDPHSPCSDGAAKLAGVWNAQKVERIAAAFRETGAPYADDSFEHVRLGVDQYGDGWLQAYAAACEDASEVVIVRRMHCLQSRLLELESLGELLAGADATVVEHAVASIGAMVGPEECLYVGGGESESGPATGSEEAAGLRWAIARAKVMGDAGRPRDGLALARDAVSKAQDLGDRALEAEALLVAGSIERTLTGIESRNEAESSIYAAILAAEAAHRPDLSARALVEYLDVAETMGHFGRISQWERRARKAVKAVGSPPVLLGRIEYTMAMVHDVLGDPVEARAAAERALVAFSETKAANRRWLTSVNNIIGELIFDQGRYEEALPYYERAFDVALEELGPHHAWTANEYGNAAEVYYKLGQYDESLEYFEAALAIRVDVFGKDSVWTVHGMGHVGDLHLELGHVQDAIDTYAEGLETRFSLRRVAGDRPVTDENTLAVYRDLQAWDQEQWLHHGLALAYIETGEFDRALEHARAIPSPGLPDDRHHPDLIGRLDAEGQALLAAGRHQEAIASLEPAAARMIEWYGAEHPAPSWPLAALGIAHLELGDPAKAREKLQAALRRRRTWSSAHPRAMGDARFALARALWQLQDEPARAISLASEAHDDYTRAANARPGDVKRVADWLSARESGAPPDAEAVVPPAPAAGAKPE